MKKITAFIVWAMLIFIPLTALAQTTVGDGDLLAQQGKIDEAVNTWKKALGFDPKNLNSYHGLAFHLYRFGLNDRVIELYRKAREELHDPRLFALELADIHVTTSQFREAFGEYLNSLRSRPDDAPRVWDMVRSIARKNGQFSGLRDEGYAALRRDPANTGILYIVANTETELGNYDAAAGLFKKMSELRNDKGESLFRFGERLLLLSACAEAEKVLQNVLLEQPKAGYAGAAKIELAAALRCRKEFGRAVAVLEGVADEFPSRKEAVEAMLLMSDIELYDLHDGKKARECSAKAAFWATMPDEKERAGIQIGESYMLERDFASARAEFEKTAAIPGATGKDRALYEVGESDYYAGEFEKALSDFQVIADEYPVSDMVNDALEKSAFIGYFREEAGPLKLFADADFEKRAGRNAEAEIGFTRVIEKYPSSPITPWAELNIARLKELDGKDREAAGAYEKFIKKGQEGILEPIALIELSDIYAFKLNDDAKALEGYKKVILEHPDSPFVVEARESIEQLRKKMEK